MASRVAICLFFFFQAEDGIRDYKVTGVQTCALPIWGPRGLVGHTFPSAPALRHTRPVSRKRKPDCSARRDSLDPDELLAGGAAVLLRPHRFLPAHSLD